MVAEGPDRGSDQGFHTTSTPVHAGRALQTKDHDLPWDRAAKAFAQHACARTSRSRGMTRVLDDQVGRAVRWPWSRGGA